MECKSLMADRVFGKTAIFFSFVGPSRPIMANFGDNSFAKKKLICVIVSRWMCGM